MDPVLKASKPKNPGGHGTQLDASTPTSPGGGAEHRQRKVLELPPGTWPMQQPGDLRPAGANEASRVERQRSVSLIQECRPAGEGAEGSDSPPCTPQTGCVPGKEQGMKAGHARRFPFGETGCGASATPQNADSSPGQAVQQMMASQHVGNSVLHPPVAKTLDNSFSGPLGSKTNSVGVPPNGRGRQEDAGRQRAFQPGHLEGHVSLGIGQSGAAAGVRVAHAAREDENRSETRSDALGLRSPPWLGHACLPMQRPLRPRSAMPIGKSPKQHAACMRPKSAGCKQISGPSHSRQAVLLTATCLIAHKRDTLAPGIGRQLVLLPESRRAQHAEHVRPHSAVLLHNRAATDVGDGVRARPWSAAVATHRCGTGSGTLRQHGVMHFDASGVQRSCSRVRTQPSSARAAPACTSRENAEASWPLKSFQKMEDSSVMRASGPCFRLQGHRERNALSSSLGVGGNAQAAPAHQLLLSGRACDVSAMQPTSQDAGMAARHIRGVERGLCSTAGNHRRRRGSLGACNVRLS
jgi:hypothetical protein